MAIIATASYQGPSQRRIQGTTRMLEHKKCSNMKPSSRTGFAPSSQKKTVYELHHLYRRQRDMMEEVKRKEYHKASNIGLCSSSSTLLPPQKPYEDASQMANPKFRVGQLRLC